MARMNARSCCGGREKPQARCSAARRCKLRPALHTQADSDDEYAGDFRFDGEDDF